MEYGHSYAHWLQMMNIFLRLAVIVMICSWVLPDSQVDVRKRQQTYRLCSYLLTNKLSELCKGSYNGFDYGKRSAGSIQEQQAQGTAVNTDRTFCR
jgi:hypothetical protein